MHRNISRIEIYKSKYCLHILHTDTEILVKQNFYFSHDSSHSKNVASARRVINLSP